MLKICNEVQTMQKEVKYMFDIFSQTLFYVCCAIVWTFGCSLICNTFIQHEEIILYSVNSQYPVGYFFVCMQF